MFVWDPPKEVFHFNIPFIDRPIVWYGVLFAAGFAFAYVFFQNLLKKQLPHKDREKAKEITDRLSIYVVIGTLVGARLGDLFFYQSWHLIAQDPWMIFRIWEGGLASHGGIAGVLIAVIFFCWATKKDYPSLTVFGLYDLMVAPGSLVAAFIRFGNFINQEIIGTPTTLPWGVLFVHPADGSPAVPRHPVQLYEALFYLFLCGLFFFLRKVYFFSGKKTGLFFVLLFSFRFLIEYVKNEQGSILPPSFPLSMGQLLSIPPIIIGIILLTRKPKASEKQSYREAEHENKERHESESKRT